MGRLLFALFGSDNPAISDLRLVTDHDQMPDDILECCATCYWCLQACTLASLRKKESARIAGLLSPVSERVYLLSLPSREELLGSETNLFVSRMSDHYAATLGVDTTVIIKNHRELVRGCLGSRNGLGSSDRRAA